MSKSSNLGAFLKHSATIDFASSQCSGLFSLQPQSISNVTFINKNYIQQFKGWVIKKTITLKKGST